MSGESFGRGCIIKIRSIAAVIRAARRNCARHSVRDISKFNQCSSFKGTSDAAPQVSALVARLYEERPLATRQQVWNRVVSTLREPRGDIAGIVDYEAALEGW